MATQNHTYLQMSTNICKHHKKYDYPLVLFAFANNYQKLQIFIGFTIIYLHLSMFINSICQSAIKEILKEILKGFPL